MLLRIRNLAASYGSLTALSGIDLELSEGETLFVAGPNGAGKSTLLRTIARAVQASSGDILMKGESILPLRASNMVSRGFCLVPEGREIFGTLTVRENLALATPRGGFDQSRLDLVLEVFPPLAERLNAPAGLLSGGQQQMLAISRALMTKARLIAIDEPSLGLAPKVVDQVYAVLGDLQQRFGLTYLIVEQSFLRAVRAGSRIAVLRSGRLVLQGLAPALHETGELEAAYFGFGSHSGGQKP